MLANALRVALAAGACVLAPWSARAQYPDSTMFAVNATTALFTVQRASGATVQVGTLSFNTSAIARDPVTGRIYYTSTNYAANLNGRVAFWDPVAKTNTVLNAAGNGDNIVRLAFNGAGQLFGIGSNSPTQLYDISPATGAITGLGPVKVGGTAGPDLGASGDLAFDYDGTLYANATDASGGTSLYRVSLVPSGGVYVATAVGQLAAAPTVEASLAFGADGQLYSAGRDGVMYIVSKLTGVATSTVTAAGIPYYDFATAPLFADLSVKGSAPAGLPRGGTANYTLVVKNTGPSIATGPITLVDSLPAGLTYSGVSGAGWTCVAVLRRVTCTNPNPIAINGSSTLVVSATVAGAAVGSLTNIMRVLGSTIDPVQANNRDSVIAPTVVNIAFALTKSHVGNFTAGINATYSFSLQNTGTVATSSNVVITDTLPTGMGFVSGTGASWACVAAGAAPVVVTCTRTNAPTLGAGATSNLSMVVSVSAAAAPSRTNVAWASGGGSFAPVSASDPTLVNTTGVAVTPDLAPVSDLPSNGTVYTANFTIVNNGSIADIFPIVVSKAPGTVLTVQKTNGVAGNTGSVSLAAGASIVVPVTYLVAAGAATGARDSLRLMATSSTVAATRDSGSYVVTVTRAALAITKRLYKLDKVTLITSGSQVAPGDTVQFLVTVAATGTAGATLVQVVDPLPAGVVYLSSTGDAPGWTITNGGGTLTADLAGALAVGATRFFWITVRVL